MKTLLFTLAAGLMVSVGSAGQPDAGKTVHQSSAAPTLVEQTVVTKEPAAQQTARLNDGDRFAQTPERTWTNFRDSTVYYVAPRPPI